MKLFRINKVEEFFNTFPKATTILNHAEKEFSNNMDVTLKKITVPPQMNFSGKIVPILINLQSIVYVGEHELFYYDIHEEVS